MPLGQQVYLKILFTTVYEQLPYQRPVLLNLYRTLIFGRFGGLLIHWLAEKQSIVC
jgi:hypothetical protein